MRLDYEDFMQAYNLFQRINSVPLEQIELYSGGVKIDFLPEDVEFFKFTGLSNKSFIEMLDENYELSIAHEGEEVEDGDDD